MCNWKCPGCGKCDHSGCDVMSSTCMYFPPRYVDGVNVNPDRNTHTSRINCHACGRTYSVSTQGAHTTSVEIKQRPSI